MSASAIASLQSADQDSRTESTSPPDALMEPCPVEKRQAIEVVVLDDNNQPLADIDVEVAQGPQQVLRQKADAYGHTRFDGLLPGSYQLTLPRTDTDAWSEIRAESLNDKALSSGDAPWAAPPSDDTVAKHDVVLGDCLSSIAFENGWLADSLWNHPINADLKRGRALMNVLNPGDVVNIPKIRRKTVTASTGTRYYLRRKGAPAMLRVRFVDFCGDPRAGLPYVVAITAADQEPIPNRKGTTDGGGFVIEPIPPDAVSALVTLSDKDFDEEVEFTFGSINPVTEVSGVKARLNNLHYPCGEENDVLDEATRSALCQFQLDHELDITGEIDGPTRAKLLDRFLS